jgi:ribose transport system ATP-binding protein
MEHMGREILFETKGVGKVYGLSDVLRNIDMEVYRGEVIGLIGENGAGKSTLLKLIAGVEQPTSGVMMMNGAAFHAKDVVDANRQGVGMVFQEQSLVQNLTVAQNIFLGREAPFAIGKIINWGRMNTAAKTALSRLRLDAIAPGKKVMDLNFVMRQMVEIAKVVDIILQFSEKGALLLLDEPTTVLSAGEIEILFQEIRNFKEKGVSVIFISHRLDEVLEITDRIYIFKDGDEVGVVNTKEADINLLYEKMVGRTTSGKYYHIDEQTVPDAEVVMQAQDLCKFGYFKDVSFELRRGEVLGFCGVEGSGKEELCGVLCGDDPYSWGRLQIRGKAAAPFSSPAPALGRSVLSIPRDRRLDGMIGMLPVRDNIIASSYKRIAKATLISAKTIREIAVNWIKKMGVKCSSILDRMDRLSGGNAQKVIFSRVISSGSEILILNHPTRGVDVGAKEEIYKTVRELTREGKSVILLGDTLDECIGLSSRVLVMKDGLIQKEFAAPADAKPDQVDIVKLMM